MYLIRHLFALIIIPLASAGLFYGQEPAAIDAAAANISVAGVVGHQETNTLMSGVTVTLSGAGYNGSVQTGPDGRFNFSVPGGNYRLTAAKGGYQFYPPAVSGDMFSDQWRDFTGSGPVPVPTPSPTPGAPHEAWSRYFDPGLGLNDVNPVLTVDSQGNVIVAGMSFNVANRYGDTDILIAKYDRFGNFLWSSRIAGSGGAQDSASDIRTDAAGNIYVTGSVWNGAEPDYDTVTAKYSPDGVQLWLRTFNGTADYYDHGNAVRVDAGGNVYVGGASIGNNAGRIDNNFSLLKYDANGNLLWTREWDGGSNDGADELELDAAGNIYLAGTSFVINGGSTSDIVTVKWTPNGTRSWVNRYDSRSPNDDTAYRLELDPSGNVLVMGRIWIRQRGEVVLFKLNGSTGANLWTRNWSRSAGVYDDLPLSLAVDRDGNAVMTGQTYYGPADQNVDVFTVKYSPNGTLAWERIFNGPSRNGFDGDNQVTIDGSNNVYVSMSSQGFNNYDLTLVKYNAAGAEQYSHRFDNDQDKDDLFWGWENGPTGSAIAVDPGGNIYLAGHSSRMSPISGALTQDIGIVKLDPQAPAAASSVTGRVLNYRGLGVAGATVTLSGAGASATATTDAAGSYSFSNVPSGTYTITATSPGFTFPTRAVEINASVAGLDIKALAPQTGIRYKK